MEAAGIVPELDLQEEAEGDESLDAFSDFVDTLDFDDLEE